MKATELTRDKLTDFYLKSTVKDIYVVVIHNQNIEPGSAEALGEIFGVQLSPLDEIEVSTIKIDSQKKAVALCDKAFAAYNFCSYELWYKGRRLAEWPKK